MPHLHVLIKHFFSKKIWLFDALSGSPRFFFENTTYTVVKCTFQQTIWKKIRVSMIFFDRVMPFWIYSSVFNEYRDRVKCRNLIMGKDPYWTLILLCKVNTNKKRQKSTGYFIFLLKMPRLTEIKSAQNVALLEAGLSQSGIEQELERALHEIWQIPQDSIRACINMQERLGKVIRHRAGNTRYWMLLTHLSALALGFGVRKYCRSDEPRGP